MLTNSKHTLPEWFPADLLMQCKKRTLKKKEYLFTLNKKANNIFFVESGEVQALRLLPNGTSAIMQRASDNDFFAEAAMCVDNYTCDAMATRKAIVYCIPKDGLEKHLQKDNDFALRFSTLLAINTRKQCSKLERLRINRARDRVLHYLVCESDSSNTITIKSSYANLAEELGLEPETLYRTLSDLQKEKVITKIDNKIALI